jgi:4-alpha-glucanotransferase
VERFIDYALSTKAETVIIPIQDYLGLDNSARINEPSVAEGNWSFMLNPDYNSKKLVDKIISHTGKFNK